MSVSILSSIDPITNTASLHTLALLLQPLACVGASVPSFTLLVGFDIRKQCFSKLTIRIEDSLNYFGFFVVPNDFSNHQHSFLQE